MPDISNLLTTDVVGPTDWGGLGFTADGEVKIQNDAGTNAFTIDVNGSAELQVVDNEIGVPAGGSLSVYNVGGPGDANYERLRMYWDTNEAQIRVQSGGSGTSRSLEINAAGVDIRGGNVDIQGGTDIRLGQFGASNLAWRAYWQWCTSTAVFGAFDVRLMRGGADGVAAGILALDSQADDTTFRVYGESDRGYSNTIGTNNNFVDLRHDGTDAHIECGGIGTAAGNANINITPEGAGLVILNGLPTSDPTVAGALWIDTAAGRVLKVSAG